MTIRTACRRAVMPLAGRKLQRCLRTGLPAPFHAPLAFLFSRILDSDAEEVVRRIEALRAAVALRPETFHIAFGETPNTARTGEQIAYRSSATPLWGTFLFLCARAFGSRTILELGSCAGISSSYLASSTACKRFITVEASPLLAELTAANLAQVSPRFEVKNATFDDALDTVLPTLEQGLDLVYIDGHHELEPTLHLWDRIKPHLNKCALVIFDDIRWSPGMWKAWGVLQRQEGLACTVDAGRFGLCLRDERSAVAKHFSFAAYLGWLRIHTPGRRSVTSLPID